MARLKRLLFQTLRRPAFKLFFREFDDIRNALGLFPFFDLAAACCFRSV
jgi:hypothetical protein